MVFGLQTQPKSWLTGYTFWVNHYLEIVFSKISVVNPPPLKFKPSMKPIVDGFPEILSPSVIEIPIRAWSGRAHRDMKPRLNEIS